MIRTLRGDLLKADAEAIVNTVNTVGVMGRGVALQISRAFPEVMAPYREACEDGRLRPGTVFTVDLRRLGKPRYIINFPTKRHWKGKSKLADIRSGLVALVAEVRRLGVASIAVPPLGCGLGGLAWDHVYPLIEESLGDLPGVEVLVYEPAGAPAAAEMTTRTPRPKMTVGQAALLGLVRRYLKPLMDDSATLLEIHKLMYFMQLAGQPLRLKYVKGHYGPYAQNLSHVLKRIEGHFTVGFGDGSESPGKVIEVLPDAAAEAETMLIDHPAARSRMDRVTQLIDGFETAYGMELLSSVHWVAAEDDPIARTDPDRAAAGVAGWSERKKKLFSPAHAKVAWARLNEQGWLTPSDGGGQS